MLAQEAGAELNAKVSSILARYYRHDYFLKGKHRHQIVVLHSHSAHKVAMPVDVFEERRFLHMRLSH